MTKVYDLVIIGGGVSALSAAIYAGRYKLSTVIITDSYGGATATAHKICNYPGFLEISGMDLISKIMQQVNSLEIPVNYEKVVDVLKGNDFFVINTTQSSFKSKRVLLAIGKKKRSLNLDKEDFFLGKGLHYCATCDGSFYKDKVVAVIGGSDSAVTSALLLSEICKKVYVIYRGEALRAEPIWLDSLFKQNNIIVIYNNEVKQLKGSKKLESIVLSDLQEIFLDGIFIEIGHIPNTELLEKLKVLLDERGEVVIDKEQRTNIPGVFAAGDCTNYTELKQIVTSTSQGAISAYYVFKDVMSEK